MRQSSVTHANQAAPTQGLKPSLQAALSCLDLQLDEELARYRRLQAGYSAPPRRVLGRRSPVPTPVELFQPPIASPPPRKAVVPPAVVPPPSVGSSAEFASPASYPPAAPKAASPAPPVSPSISPPAEPDRVPAPIAPETAIPSPVSPEALGALAVVPSSPAATSPPDLALAPPPAFAPDAPLPDDYLASSEALLQSLAAEEVQDDRLDPSQIKNKGGLLSPLGLGSLLLLLLSSLSLGYALLNPNSLRFFHPNLQGRESPAQSPPAVTPTTLPNVPNLATDEFVDLHLDTLGTLTVPSPAPTLAPSASPSPSSSAASPSPVANPLAAPTATTATPIETIPLRVVQPQVTVPSPIPASPRTAVAPRSQPASPPRSTPAAPTSTLPSLPVPATHAPPPRVPVVTPTVPTASATARSQPDTYDTYNVVTEYRGNESLSQLQQVAPGAYLRNFNEGIRVQLGTFDDRASAQEMVEQLNQQGVPAQIQAE